MIALSERATDDIELSRPYSLSPKLSNYDAREYDRIAVENLSVERMIESPSNSRNCAGAAWGMFLWILAYKR